MTAREQLASDLAATYYAALLRPDPTLPDDRDEAAVAAYLDEGRRLFTQLLAPHRKVTIRCEEGTRRSGLKTRALATVHDRRLLVIQSARGTAPFGMRLTRYSVIELPMAAREGHTSVTCFCNECKGIHDLPLRWLKKAPPNDASDRISPYDPYCDREPVSLENWYRKAAFARVIGPLRPEGLTANTFLLITVEWNRFSNYATYFGNQGHHLRHLLRLTGGATFAANKELQSAIGAVFPDDGDDFGHTFAIHEVHADA